jgi:hypothetical protein
MDQHHSGVGALWNPAGADLSEALNGVSLKSPPLRVVAILGSARIRESCQRESAKSAFPHVAVMAGC